MRWPFAKYAACGNDFVLFDNRLGVFPYSSRLIQALCLRQTGIGADGVILVEQSMDAHVRMRIFNPDGAEAAMCGNGLLCLATWVATLGLRLSSYQIETMQRVLSVSRVGEACCIHMGMPSYTEWGLSLSLPDQRRLSLHSLDTGVPHTVLFVSDVDDFDLAKWGPWIRHHSRWQPEGTNVTIVQSTSIANLKIRTYERGVEGETLACGTGAVAASLAAAYQYGISAPVTVETRSGKCLTVGFTQHQGRFNNVSLTGQAVCSFHGEIDLEPVQKRILAHKTSDRRF